MKLRHNMVFRYHSNKDIDWNELRSNQKNTDYWIPESKIDYINQRQLSLNENNWLSFLEKYVIKYNLNYIYSLGSGRANFEYFLKKTTGLHTTITDLSDSIIKIKKFNLFDKVIQMDLNTKISIDNPVETLVILPRIDTELSDYELENLIHGLKKLEVEHIFFITGQLLNLKTYLIELKIIIKSLVFGYQLVNCGVSRSKSEFIDLFSKYYNLTSMDNYKSILLTKK